MLWPVPLPLLTQLRRSLLRLLRKDQSVLIRPSGYESTLWLDGGAEALSYICSHLTNDQQKPVRLLLPAYFCGQSLRYLRQDGVEFLFYSLNDDLSPNTSTIEPLINQKKANVFLHVHYFGLLIETQSSAEFCKRHSAILVEDCTHFVSPLIKMNFVGDFLFFAPHKLIPVQRGGLLLAKSELPDLQTQKQGQLSISWYLKRIAQRYLIRNNFWQRQVKWEIIWSDDVEVVQYNAPSQLEIELMTERLNYPQALIDARRSNASRIAKLIESEDNLQLLKNFSQHDVPYIVGLRFTKLSNLHKFAKALNQFNCPYMMWPDLPTELAMAEGNFQADLDRTMLTLFLFVHEEIDINTYTTSIKKALDAAK